MKDYIEERAMKLALYIVENGATVREAAKHFAVSKSTVHTVRGKWNAWQTKPFPSGTSD